MSIPNKIAASAPAAHVYQEQICDWLQGKGIEPNEVPYMRRVGPFAVIHRFRTGKDGRFRFNWTSEYPAQRFPAIRHGWPHA